MKTVLIIEDELIAAQQLESMILEIRPDYQIKDKLVSIRDVLDWFKQNENPDLIFMDIHLSDGLSFSIFNQIKIDVPIIFTTAYDQYALRAFKVNSIDYLLKPIEHEALKVSIEKYETWSNPSAALSPQLIDQLINSIGQKKYRSRYLVKSGTTLEYLTNAQICFFYSEDGIVFARSRENKRYLMDSSLDQLESIVDPSLFFRINRQVILHIQAIDAIHPYLNSRLKIDCITSKDFALIVARERSSSFKKWLDETIS